MLRPKRFKLRAVVIAIIVFVILICVPAMLMKVYYRMSDADQAQMITEQETLVDLSAQAIKIKLDGLVSSASSMASSSTLSSDAAHGQWLKAADAARDMQNNVKYYDPFIDRVIIYDPQGVQQAAYPALTGGLGKSATGSLWYKALSSGGVSSYVSNVALRVSVPQIQVVNVAVPIKSDVGGISGFLVLQIPTDNFLEFGENISLGTYGFAYVVDSAGNLVAHPKFSSENGEVVNYLFDPAVRNVVNGESGGGIVDQGTATKGIVVYTPIPGYGWGVIGRELYAEAFAGNGSILFDIALLIAICTIIDLLISYMLFRILNADSSVAPPPSRGHHGSKGFTLIELLVVIAIIAILAVVVVLTLNPAQLLAQSRDANRVSDFATLKSALSLYLVDTPIANLASSSYGYGSCYLSTASGNGTTTASCGGVFAGTYSNASTSNTLYRLNDSRGWLPVNFSQLSYGTPLGTLPIDPTNNATYYYAYTATTTGGNYFELDAFMESTKYSTAAVNDGGDKSNVYEAGTKPGLNL